MKTLAGMIVLVCALTCLVAPVRGQITITAADATTALAVGDSLAYKIDKVTSTLNIGQPGASSWDFSALRTDSSQTLRSVSVSSTPFASQFPSATHAFQTNLNVVFNGVPIAATGYVYFDLATNLLNLGQRATAASPPGTLVSDNIPADVYYALPSTFGTTWTSAYFDTTDIFLFGTILASASSTRHTVSYAVDGYGPMTLPGGSVHDALRIKKSDSIASYSSGALTIGKTVGYIFMAKDFASVQITNLDMFQADNGVISIQPGSTSWNGQLVALPIQLASFNASVNPSGPGALLRWKTLSEVNNYGFQVERGTASAGAFESLPGAFIPGHGTTTVPCDYTYTDGSEASGTWYYRLKQIDLDGSFRFSDPAGVNVQLGGATGDVPLGFSLGQNFPNPFNPETTIRYGLPAGSPVELSVYNALGERVALLVHGVQEAGFHEVRFDGSALASGVYFYRLQAAGFVQTKKLSLLR